MLHNLHDFVTWLFVGWYKALFGVERLRTRVPADDAIFNYVMIEARCSDNPGVHIKGVRISEGALYSTLGCRHSLHNTTSAVFRQVCVLGLGNIAVGSTCQRQIARLFC